MEPSTQSKNILSYHFEYKNGVQLDIDTFPPEYEKAYAEKCTQLFAEERHQQKMAADIDNYLLKIEPYDPPYPAREGLNALRLHYLWVVSDAMKRSFGEKETVRVLTEKQPEGEHNLLESIMSIWATWDKDSDTFVLDTGSLSKEQFWTDKITGVLDLIRDHDFID